jgi:predicted Rossmann-fold nucleotide-binding protein
VTVGLPFNPLREALYTPSELFEGFSADDPGSYARCPDLRILSYFVSYGVNPVTDAGASTLEALHDSAISRATLTFRSDFTNVVAMMGGHGMGRGTEGYAGVAQLSHDLASRGFLVVSGGGPGAMEATHLGALFSKQSKTELDRAIAMLGTAALPSDVAELVGKDGRIDARIAAELHAWLKPAIEIAGDFSPGGAGVSLGVPTWLYGYEPSTPFATRIAKYFQNSLREDGLVTLGVNGIVYAAGSAGTVQEIFQDAAQNYYGEFYPMVFLSAPNEDYWEKKLPVRPLIEALLGKKPDFGTKVLFTDSWQKAVRFLSSA